MKESRAMYLVAFVCLVASSYSVGRACLALMFPASQMSGSSMLLAVLDLVSSVVGLVGCVVETAKLNRFRRQ